MKITLIHILDPEKSVTFDGNDWLIEFGEGRDRIHVAAGPEGKIDVRSPSGAAIRIEPRAANSVWMSNVKKLERLG